MEGIALRDAEYQIINKAKEFQAERLNINTEPATEVSEVAPSATESENETGEGGEKIEKIQKSKKTKTTKFIPKVTHTDSLNKDEEPIETEIKPGVAYKFED